MIVLGITSDFHDSSAAILRDGELIAAANEERFTRNKHDSGFPQFAIDFCLQKAGIQSSDIDQVAFFEKPFFKWIRILESGVKNWPAGASDFANVQSVWLGKKMWRKASIAKKLDISPFKIIEVGHHQSHLMQAVVGSSFDSAAVLTIDAVGEKTTALMAKMTMIDGTPRFEILQEAVFPHSLGLFYSAMTAFLGFKPMNDECSVMALAAFGQPLYLEKLNRVLELKPNGFWQVHQDYFDFDDYLNAPWKAKFVDEFGFPRESTELLPFSSFEIKEVSERQQHWADMAASVQALYEKALLHSVNHLQNITGDKNLCLAGGAALNCVANSKVLQETPIEQLHIPLDPGDGGAAIGAAYWVHTQKKNLPMLRTPQAIAMGEQGNDLESMLEHLDVEHLQEYQKLGEMTDTRSWKWKKFFTSEDMAEAVSSLLVKGKVVGFFQGRFEQGPRALGQRSILFRADDIDLAVRVSGNIKNRAAFRPYALALLAEDEILDLNSIASDNQPLRFMQLAIPVKENQQKSLRAGLHVDGTTRPQLVENGAFHQVLKSFKGKTGVGALINTSMNESGFPLIGSSEEALHFFARTSLDALVVDQLVITKEEQ